MVRYRNRSTSYSPRRSRTPPRQRRFNGNRDGSYADHRSSASSGLLIRNISLEARPEDLRIPFERFGPVKDVYLPKDYYTREPRGFGFVKFRYPKDAAEAKHHLNHTVIGGREIAIVFADENRKTPQEMRTNSRVSVHSGGSYRRRSPRRRYHSYSRSPSPPRHDSRDRDYGTRDYYSPLHSRSVSRSPSPLNDGAYKSRRKLTSPRGDCQSPLDKMDHRSDRSPILRQDNRGPHDKRGHGFAQRSPISREDGQSLLRSRSPVRSRSHSRSYSPR